MDRSEKIMEITEGNQTGVVEWFNQEKGYGVVTDNNGFTYFIHRSHVRSKEDLERIKKECGKSQDPISSKFSTLRTENQTRRTTPALQGFATGKVAL
jgi:hypothetical protein